MYSTKDRSTFKVHVSRVHSVRCEDSFTPAEDAVEELADCSDNTSHDVTNSQLLCASFMLKIESKHKLSQSALDCIAFLTNDLVVDHLKLCEPNEHNNTSGASIGSRSNVNAMMELSTQYKQRKFYEEHCAMIPCKEVN